MDEQPLKDWAKLAQSITDEDRALVRPPETVWDNINAAVADDRGGLVPPPIPILAPDQIPKKGLGGSIVRPNDEIVPPEGVIDLTAARSERAPAAARKSRRQLILGSAAALLAVVLGISQLTGTPTGPETLFTADVTNDTLDEDYDGTAFATVANPAAPVISIDFESTLPQGEIVELWLVHPDPDSGEIIATHSLGRVSSGATEWDGDWPEGLDPTEFTLIDLSIEDDDGDDSHSGRSFLRGQLTEA